MHVSPTKSFSPLNRFAINAPTVTETIAPRWLTMASCLLRPTPMDVAVAAAHRAKARAKISARNVEQRFAESGSPRLVANQWCEDVAFLQKQAACGADGFLALADIDAACDEAAPIETNEFFLQACASAASSETLRGNARAAALALLFGFRFALRRLKHLAILREINIPRKKILCRSSGYAPRPGEDKAAK